ncbi:hypothetical protein Tco_0893324 [Tanacetum coccineum]|uniref:Uncharacterized protein n=1 Tax=Tanacetum coccineum TaxID=301880 RepID=A0ABQ5CB75_9ASTR
MTRSIKIRSHRDLGLVEEIIRLKREREESRTREGREWFWGQVRERSDDGPVEWTVDEEMMKIDEFVPFVMELRRRDEREEIERENNFGECESWAEGGLVMREYLRADKRDWGNEKRERRVRENGEILRDEQSRVTDEEFGEIELNRERCSREGDSGWRERERRLRDWRLDWTSLKRVGALMEGRGEAVAMRDEGGGGCDS